MDFNKLLQSRIFKIISAGLAGMIVILIIFAVGIFVGYNKASFSLHWGESYHRNFGGPRNGFFGNMAERDFIDAHGVFGQIIKIDGSTLIIKGQGNVEKVVLVTEQTTINKFNATVKLEDLKLDDYIVIIGEPNNDGQIIAQLIRIMPPPPTPGAPPQFRN